MQSQTFVAPRFAALAQQDQSDAMGPTGRPQLAPGFLFGARRRTTSNIPMAPPINEEDVGFQFPQQQQQQAFLPEDVIPQTSMHRKTDSGEITGIMAEQV
jgi:protein SSD1